MTRSSIPIGPFLLPCALLVNHTLYGLIGNVVHEPKLFDASLQTRLFYVL